MKDQLLRLGCAVSNVPVVLRARMERADRGQTASEYLGIMVLVAAIIVAIFGVRVGGGGVSVGPLDIGGGGGDTIADAIAGAIGGAVETIINAGE